MRQVTAARRVGFRARSSRCLRWFRYLSVLAVGSACGRSELAAALASADPLIVEDRRGACEAELMQRWNLAVEAVSPMPRDFTWRERDDFPHPTFRLGDQVAYELAADVALTFWASPGTFDLVESCNLLDVTFASGPTSDHQKRVSLRSLTRELTQSWLVREAQRRRLNEVCQRIGCR